MTGRGIADYAATTYGAVGIDGIRSPQPTSDRSFPSRIASSSDASYDAFGAELGTGLNRTTLVPSGLAGEADALDQPLVNRLPVEHAATG